MTWYRNTETGMEWDVDAGSELAERLDADPGYEKVKEGGKSKAAEKNEKVKEGGN